MAMQQHTIDTPYMVGPVHSYTIEVNGELILFDPGPPTERAKRYMRESIDLKRLRYVFVTHCHIDHYGLTRWLEEESGAQIFLPHRDDLKIVSHNERLQGMYSIMQGMGFDDVYLEELNYALSSVRVFPPFPMNYKVVEEDMPDHLGIEYLSCPGHSQSDLVYIFRKWAVTGDVLLRGVFQSPLLDVDLETGERFKNYRAYCATLIKLSSLREKIICPAHRKSVESVDATLLFYIERMLDRAVQLTSFVEEKNISAIISRFFGRELKEPFLIYLKASEILFLQDFLKQPETLKKSLETIGLFDAVAERYDGAVSNRGENST